MDIVPQSEAVSLVNINTGYY